jgi:hypothetical protein
VEDYPTPEAFAERLEMELWKILEAAYPADEVPDAFDRESRRHNAYAAPRRRLYLDGKRYKAALGEFLLKGTPRVLIDGASAAARAR